MSEWVDQFQNHAVHQRLQTLQGLLKEIEDTGEPSPDATAVVDRLKQVGIQAVKRMSTLDPILVPISSLNQLDSHLQQVISHCEQYKSANNVVYLTNADAQVDAILLQLGSLPSFRSTEELEGLSESIVSLRRSVGQYRRYVSDEREGLQAQIEDAKGELEGLDNNITAQQARVDEVVSEFQRQFSESEERRRTEFAESEKNQETRFRDSQEKWDGEFKRFIEGQSTLSENHLENIAAHKKRAEELLHVIANTGMVGGYQRIANDERKVAVRWQIITVAAFVGLIIFAILAFSATLGSNVSWQAFGARVFVAAAFGVLGAYAARQAERHEAVERSNRRLELALASIDPYLVSLPEDKQHQVKQELAMKFFGETPEIKQKAEEINGNSADLLRMAIETVSELAKKSPGPP